MHLRYMYTYSVCVMVTILCFDILNAKHTTSHDITLYFNVELCLQVRGRLRQHGCPSVPNCKEDEYSLCSSRTLPLHPYHNMHVQYHHQGHHTDNHSTRAGSVAGSISSSMHPGRYRQQLRYHRRSGWHGPGRPSRQSGEWGDSSSSSDGEVEWKGFGVL